MSRSPDDRKDDPGFRLLGNPEPVTLDYRGARGRRALVRNISGIAADGEDLWTVSDEGRTVERLQRSDEGYALAEQLDLDALFPGLPKGKEADLEAVDVAEGVVWVCGSHCRVRRKPAADGSLRAGLRRRPSRHLLGAFGTRAASRRRTVRLPFTDEGSLRSRLRGDPILSAFMDLPSKENGLDIEAVAVLGQRLFVGLRGPVVDGNAVVVQFKLRKDGAMAEAAPFRHLLQLDGLGIRDLARDGDAILVLAGPVTAAEGPFRIHRWRPEKANPPLAVPPAYDWTSGPESPEGICRLDRHGKPGLLVVYDGPDEGRVDGARYRADWFALHPPS